MALALVAADAGVAAVSRSPSLSRIATEFRGEVRETILCAATQDDWQATLSARRLPSYTQGFAYIGVPRVWLSPSICAGVPKLDPWAVLVYLHELVHTTGVRSERKANCLALAAERPFLQRFFGATPEQAQAVYEQSLARALAEPPAYRPVGC